MGLKLSVKGGESIGLETSDGEIIVTFIKRKNSNGSLYGFYIEAPAAVKIWRLGKTEPQSELGEEACEN